MTTRDNQRLAERIRQGEDRFEEISDTITELKARPSVKDINACMRRLRQDDELNRLKSAVLQREEELGFPESKDNKAEIEKSLGVPQHHEERKQVVQQLSEWRNKLVEANLPPQ